MDKGKRGFALGPWRKVLIELQTGPRCTIHMSLRLFRKPLGFLEIESTILPLMEQ
jgi:hypothetical protein